jgi:histidinol phosphatase-like PHP family hydrolase
MGIPITLNSDAHKPEELSGYFDEARQILKEIGFRYLKLYTPEGWEDTLI